MGDSHEPGGMSSEFCCIVTGELPQIRARSAKWQEETAEVIWVLNYFQDVTVSEVSRIYS